MERIPNDANSREIVVPSPYEVICSPVCQIVMFLEARHGERIGHVEGGGRLALPLAEALLRDVLAVWRLEHSDMAAVRVRVLQS